jgi:hypothetical protein
MNSVRISEEMSTCAICDDWLRPCFPCRWNAWRTKHNFQQIEELTDIPPAPVEVKDIPEVQSLSSSLSTTNYHHVKSFSYSSLSCLPQRKNNNDISVMVTQISGLEFLFHNILSIGNDRRRSYLFWNNQALAEAIMMFGDYIHDTYENPELTLEIYLDALSFKSTYIPLIARVLSFLLIVNRHTEVLSLAISLIEWPTQRFTPDIWLQCCHSLWEEIPAQMSDYALVVPVSLAILKSRFIAQLQADQRALHTFLLTEHGIVLDPLTCLLSEFLGGHLIANQVVQLQSILYYLSRQVPSLCNALIGDLHNNNEHGTNHVYEFELTGIFDSHAKPRVWNTLFAALSSNDKDVRCILQAHMPDTMAM